MSKKDDEKIIINGKSKSESINLNNNYSDSINLNNSIKEESKNRVEDLNPTVASLINRSIISTKSKVELLSKEYEELNKNGNLKEDPKIQEKINKVKKELNDEINKLDNLYRKREYTLRFDKSEKINDIEEYDRFIKSRSYISQNGGSFYKNSQYIRHKKEELKSPKESTLSKSRKAYRDIQTKIQKNFKPANSFINLKNRTSNKFSKGVKTLKGKFLKIFRKILSFLFTTIPGWIIMFLICSIGFVVITTTSVSPSFIKEYNQEVQSEMVEYKAWNYYFNNSENTDKFYKQYHAYVPGSNLSAIIYTFRDYDTYKETVQKCFSELNIKDYETAEEYENDVYKNAVELYANEFDVYELRELFLDHLEYNYTYLKREWSDWENTKAHHLSTNLVPFGASIDAYINNAIDDENNRLESIGKEHDEFLLQGVTSTTITVNYLVEDYGYVDKYDEISEEFIKSYEVVGEHSESYEESVYVNSYKYRDVLSESWTSNKGEAEKNVNRSSLKEGLNDTALYDYWSDVVVENGLSKPWETHYIENDIIVKIVRHWVLKPYKEVYNDLAYKYNPETKYEEYNGDTLNLTINDDVYGEVTINIDKSKIYKLYYAADDNPLIYKENIFLDEKLQTIEETMISWRTMFSNAKSLVINGYSDFDNENAWRAYNDPDITGTNEYSTSLYGQCTWFVEGLFIQNFDYPMGFTANGNCIASKLVSTYPDDYELSSIPIAGSFFSCGLNELEGHTGLVIDVSDDGDFYTISHGNLNVISDPFDVAMTDWRIEVVTLDWFSFLGDYEFANPIC